MQNPGGRIDITTIEHCGFAALPPEHTREDGPWVLRMAGGLAKRANSANPRAPASPSPLTISRWSQGVSWRATEPGSIPMHAAGRFESSQP